ncbi:MAG: hypothetical protein V2A73_09340 [Pseudomonadota bacterium]
MDRKQIARVAKLSVASSAAIVLHLAVHSTCLAIEDEQMLSVGPSYLAIDSLSFDGNSRRTHGMALLSDYQRALDDTLWLRATLGGGAIVPQDGTGWCALGSIALVYSFDTKILRLVPQLSASAGVVAVWGSSIATNTNPYLGVGIGFKVLQTRTFSWGLEVSYAYLGGKDYFMAGPSFSYHWAYF